MVGDSKKVIPQIQKQHSTIEILNLNLLKEINNIQELNFDIWQKLSLGYLLRGKTVRYLCTQNCNLANKYGQNSIASIWKIILILLKGPKNNFDLIENLENMHQSNENEQIKENEILANDDLKEKKFVQIEWLYKNVLREFLYERVEQGDMLHCVSVCEIIKEWYVNESRLAPKLKNNEYECMNFALNDNLSFIKFENIGQGWHKLLGLTAQTVREWYVSYVDILRRFGLFSVATEIIKYSFDPMVGRKSMLGTVVHASCSKCKSSLGHSTRCTKCGGVSSRCAICHQQVRGLYVWCPGCSHGGHLSHMEDWFAISNSCPTG
eukprot:CAMPEP_0171471438 /NCGR_PEP_ID=MMETSP0946-20130122/707_1 /TAXON_ID=109269 /ORGANISM="Vaucheria litorea, Strain CCMP2940" /LENGTH=321 /DNA_ID=CAMNT_0012000933 /DNA_START=1332 /DNA_END=2294 /DNA_ORIENTATION=-